YGGRDPGWGSERVENGIREFEGVRESYSRVLQTSSQGCGVDLSAFLLAWRTTSLPDREVVDALVHPAHAGPSPALAAVLAHWPGGYYWSDEPDGRHLILTRPMARRRERWGLHVALFLATLVTTTFAGAVVAGTIPFDDPLALFTGSYPLPPHLLGAWAAGLSFSVPQLARARGGRGRSPSLPLCGPSRDRTRFPLTCWARGPRGCRSQSRCWRSCCATSSVTISRRVATTSTFPRRTSSRCHCFRRSS